MHPSYAASAAFEHMKIKYPTALGMLKQCTFYNMYFLRWKNPMDFFSQTR